MRKAFKLLVEFVLLASAIGRWAFGYIDPNTGGMLFQVLALLFAFLSGLVLFFSRQIRIALARAGRFLRGIMSH